MAWNGKLFGVPVISKKACVRMAIGVSALAIGCGWLYYRGVMMPGSSYHGEFAALDAQETELATNLERHVTVLAGDIRQRNALYITGLERARDYIEAELTSYGYTDLERQTYAIDGSQMYTNDASFRGAMDGVEVWNVAAELRGQTRPEEILVIGAHYDSVDECPAANDNGSGVAATLELARMLHGKRLDRTVRFVFFTNEEPPYFQTSNMGSYQYAWHCQQRGDQVVGMLSLETMAYYVDDPRSQKYPSPLDKF